MAKAQKPAVDPQKEADQEALAANASEDSEEGEPEVVVTGKKPAPVANAPKVADSANKPTVRDRIKRIEEHFGQEFTERLVAMHDHVFGAPPEKPKPAPAPAPVPAKPVEDSEEEDDESED